MNTYHTCYRFLYLRVSFHFFSFVLCTVRTILVPVPVVADPDMHSYVGTASAFKYHTERDPSTQLILEN
jgi:hypothetical protein